MKNLFKMSLAALLLGGIVGCSEAPEESAYVPEFSKEDITATISEETRTLLGAENEVLWSEGDAISFFNKSTLNQKYVLKSGKGTTKGTFGFDSYTGTHTALTQNYSVYPWGDVAIDETNKKVTGLELAAEQTYTVGQPLLNGAPMVAVSDSREMQFKNTIGLIRVNVKAQLPAKYTLNGIEFTSAANNLAGEAEISLESNELTVVGEGKTVEVTLAEAAEVKVDEAVAVYALIPATAFAAKDLTITLKLTNNFEGTEQEVVKVVPSAFTLERSKIFTFNITFKEEDVVGETEKYENASEAALVDAAMNGGEVTLTEDVVLSSTLVVTGDMVINLNGRKITNKVENTATDVLVVREGAELTINGEGTVEAVSGNDGYPVIAEGKVTINGGTYRSGLDQENAVNSTIYARGKGEIYIYGGDFSTPTGDFVLNKKDADRSTTTILVYGGKFHNFNPANNASEGANTNFVAEGYSVVELEDGVWTVVEGTGEVVTTPDAMVEALENGEDVILYNDIKIDPATMSNAYGKTGINVKNGQTIDGGGNTLDIRGAGDTWDSGINTTGGVIKNLSITGSFRGVFVNHNSTHSEPVVLENVHIYGTTYTISCDQGMNQNLEATDCSFKGWTSYAATLGKASFTRCYFGEGNGYNFMRPYAPTTYVDCEFGPGFEMDPRAAVTFKNCKIDGVALTAANLSTLVIANIANATVIE